MPRRIIPRPETNHEINAAGDRHEVLLLGAGKLQKYQLPVVYVAWIKNVNIGVINEICI